MGKHLYVYINNFSISCDEFKLLLINFRALSAFNIVCLIDSCNPVFSFFYFVERLLDK